MQGAVFRGGGDYVRPAPGRRRCCRPAAGIWMCRTLEFALPALSRLPDAHLCIGTPPARQIEMHKVAVEALDAAKDALRPGRPIGEVFDAHALVVDAAGMEAHRLNACGYSLGATYAPNWMDWPMFFHGNPVEAAPGMVFFIHIVIFDSDAGLAMTTGQTVAVTGAGCEALTRASLDLVMK